MRGKPGVYCLHNIDKNKYYIGQSDGLEERINAHYNNMKNHCKTVVPDLQKDFDSGDRIVAKVLKICDSYVERKRLEKLYQILFGSYDRECGYNYREKYFNSKSFREACLCQE